MFASKKLIYLGVPYTHLDMEVRTERFRRVSRCAGWLFTQQGTYVYSPISMTHQMWIEMQNMPNTSFEWEAWAAFDEFMVAKADEFWILTIPGWRESVGVAAEKVIAEKLGLPVRYISELSDGTYLVTNEAPAA